MVGLGAGRELATGVGFTRVVKPRVSATRGDTGQPCIARIKLKKKMQSAKHWLKRSTLQAHSPSACDPHQVGRGCRQEQLTEVMVGRHRDARCAVVCACLCVWGAGQRAKWEAHTST
jgi:hypothetical protein